jgi:hypothetical protein
MRLSRDRVSYTPAALLAGDCFLLLYYFSLIFDGEHAKILSGVYPVSQVREPYSSVQFLAERVPLVRLLGLTWPYEPGSVSDAPTKPQWSAWAVCDGF